MRYPIVILLIISLIIGQIGCVRKPSEMPPRLSEQVRGQLGTIGVVSGRFIPEAEFYTPARGKAGGATRGTAIGATKGLALGGALGCQYAGVGGGSDMGSAALAFGLLVICLGSMAVGATAGAIIGGVEGVSSAESAETVEEAEAVLKECMAELNIQELMRDRVIQVAQDQTHHHLVLLAEQGPSTPEEEVDYRLLLDQGIDTILEISVMTLGLTGEWDVNPPLVFFMTMRTRLIRVLDGEVLYLHTFKYESEEHKFTDWGDNNAQLLREKFDLFYQHLAETIVDERL